jgi:hypothetical protein
MEWILLAALPAMAVLTILSWRLARRYWPYKIPVVIALVNTIVGACATWLTIVNVFRSTLGLLPDWFAILTSTSIVAQSTVVFLNTALLAFLDRQQKRDRPHRRSGEEGYMQ